jgi:hypothetical protein
MNGYHSKQKIFLVNKVAKFDCMKSHLRFIKIVSNSKAIN